MLLCFYYWYRKLKILSGFFIYIRIELVSYVILKIFSFWEIYL